jgi:hypothetical protein
MQKNKKKTMIVGAKKNFFITIRGYKISNIFMEFFAGNFEYFHGIFRGDLQNRG